MPAESCMPVNLSKSGLPCWADVQLQPACPRTWRATLNFPLLCRFMCINEIWKETEIWQSALKMWPRQPRTYRLMTLTNPTGPILHHWSHDLQWVIIIFVLQTKQQLWSLPLFLCPLVTMVDHYSFCRSSSQFSTKVGNNRLIGN